MVPFGLSLFSGELSPPVLRLHGIPSMAMDGPWQFHPWPSLVHEWTRDGNRHFYPWPGNQKSGKLKTAYRSSVF